MRLKMRDTTSIALLEMSNFYAFVAWRVADIIELIDMVRMPPYTFWLLAFLFPPLLGILN